ncbi:SRPBCC domain-containing protein [Sphingopyxis sp. LARHCG72]
METGATVEWDFHDFPGAFPVYVIEVVADEKIVLEWQASEGEAHNIEGSEPKDADYRTRVTMNFKGLDDGRTLVEIAEEGWRENQAALGASYGNCQGWSQMLCALKAWIEHGINLREGMYK